MRPGHYEDGTRWEALISYAAGRLPKIFPTQSDRNAACGDACSAKGPRNMALSVLFGNSSNKLEPRRRVRRYRRWGSSSM